MFDGARGRMQECCAPAPRGTWCSGITSASHAEGPGLKSQCVHLRQTMPGVQHIRIPALKGHKQGHELFPTRDHVYVLPRSPWLQVPSLPATLEGRAGTWWGANSRTEPKK